MNAMVNADLAMFAYAPPKLKQDGTAEKITAGRDGQFEFVVVRHVDRPSGYQGTIYRSLATGDYIVAHRGTEFDRELIKDGTVDAGMVAGKVNAQLKDALELTRQAKELAEREGKSLHVTGHSLGGTLAQITAHHYNLPGDAFNPYGAAGLSYRIQEGQSAGAAPFTNHVMAGDFVSAASKHYGKVEMYALPGELETLRKAESAMTVAGRVMPFTAPVAATTALIGGLADSHRMKHFVDRPDETPPKRSVLDDATARIDDPDDRRRVGAFRENVHTLRSGITLAARGMPGLVKDGIDAVRGYEAPGAHALREAAAAERAANPYTPAAERNAPAATSGAPSLQSPAFNGRTQIQESLDTLFAHDPERLLALRREFEDKAAGHAQSLRQHDQAGIQQAQLAAAQGSVAPAR